MPRAVALGTLRAGVRVLVVAAAALILASPVAASEVIAVDATAVTLQVDGGGFFFGPTLLDHVTPEMRAYRDEIFGPVVSVVRVPTFDDALALVNDNPYGSGTAIFTRDGGAARRFQTDVNCGMVGVNVPIPVPVGYHSFGGWKDSLFGDLHIYGNDGIAFYTQGKVITTRWPDPSDGGINLGFPSNS